MYISSHAPLNNERNSTRSLVKLYWPLASSGFQLDSPLQDTLAFAVYLLGDIPKIQNYVEPEFLHDGVLGSFHHSQTNNAPNVVCWELPTQSSMYSKLNSRPYSHKPKHHPIQTPNKNIETQSAQTPEAQTLKAPKLYTRKPTQPQTPQTLQTLHLKPESKTLSPISETLDLKPYI